MENHPSEESQIKVKNSSITTIKLSNQTKSRIDHLKRYPRESYEEIMVRMLEILNIARHRPEHARISLLKLERERRKNLKITSKSEEIK